MKRVGIIGGGPAGLGAAHALSCAGIDFELFDAGPSLRERRHDCADELGTGIGGAGLFSDGKFSYFPSGTHLYQLGNKPRLWRAYDKVRSVLAAAGISAPEFPTQTDIEGAFEGVQGHKSYPSQYGSLAQRQDLIRLLLESEAESSVQAHCTVRSVRRGADSYLVRYCKRDGTEQRALFSDIVFATGRFGGAALGQLCDGLVLDTEELRYELGVRVEHPNGLGFLGKIRNPDVKLITQESSVEVRTFCTCRHGEIWHIPYGDISALSGRSDGPPSAYSNFGLLPRFTGRQRAEGRAIWQHFRTRQDETGAALWQPAQEFVGGYAVQIPSTAQRPWFPRERFARGDIGDAAHPRLVQVLREAVASLFEQYPDLDSPETMCLFPAVEGVGTYPSLDADLRLPAERVWCCGDLVGKFRGLIPALVSGYYVGLEVAQTEALGRTMSTVL